MMHRSHVGFLVLAAMLLHGAAPARASDWPTLHRDPARSGFTPDQVTAPIHLDWIAEFPGESLTDRSEVIVAEGKVYAGTLSGNLYALDRHTGRTLWKHAGGAPVLHSPAVVERTVYYATAGAQGALFALDAATGRQRWKVATPGGFAASPLVLDGVVYVGARSGCFYGIEAGSGRVRFRFWTEGPIRSTAAAANGRVFFASDSMTVHALEAGTGRLLWKSAPVPGWSFRDCIPLVVGNQVIVRSGPVRQAAPGEAQDPDAGDSRPAAPATHLVLEAATGVRSVGQDRQAQASENAAGSPAPDSLLVPFGGASPALTRDGRPIVLCRPDPSRTERASAPAFTIGWLDPVRGTVEPIRLTESTPLRLNTGARSAGSTPAASVGGNILYLTQQNALVSLDLTTGRHLEIHGDSETRNASPSSPFQDSDSPGPAGGACSISDDQLFRISAGRIIAMRGNGSPRHADALPVGTIVNVADRLPNSDGPARNRQPGKSAAESAGGHEAAARLLFSPSRVRGIRGWRASSLKQALQEQVQALREGWPWAPFHVPGGSGGRDSLFGHPADTVEALAQAFPHLSGSTADWARAQAQVLLPRCLEDRGSPPSTGRRREFYAVPTAELTGGAHVSPPLIAQVYSVWLYGDRTGDWRSVELTYARCRELLQAYLQQPPAVDGVTTSSYRNRVLMGLVASARLASRFGDPGTQRSAEEQATRLFAQVASDYQRRGAEASQAMAAPARGEGPLSASAPFLCSPRDGRPSPFMDLSPELGRALRAAVPDGVEALSRAVRLLMPAYYVAGEDRLLGGRGGLELPDAAHAIFQAHAWLWVDSADVLAEQVDLARCRGDLYNIAELAAALEAFGTREWGGASPPAPRSIASIATPVDRDAGNGASPVSPARPAPDVPPMPAGDGIGSEPLPDAAGPRGERNPWRYIVIHHSASPSGNAAAFDRLHRSKGWDCVAYHFVITNGRGGPDGGLETGLRWEQQKHGAHAGGLSRGASSDLRNDYNEFGVGICLVGNFQNGPPTQAQLRTLATLVKRLQGEFGIPADRVFGHRHVRDTACPGGRFPWGQLYALMGLPTPGHLHRLAAAPTSDHCVWCQRREAMIASSSSTARRGMPMSPASSVLPIPMMASPAKR